MLENFHIKIVRLKTGEDIICFCYEDYKNNKVYIKYPKSFYMAFDPSNDNQELVLEDWLNPLAFALSDVYIRSEDVLFLSYSNISFGCRYLSELLNTLDDESELYDGIKETLEKYQQDLSDELIPNKTTIH